MVAGHSHFGETGDNTQLGSTELTSIEAQPPPIQDQLDDLRRENEQHQHEIDALQVLAADRRVPWYRSINSLIPVLSLVFSLITVTISAFWSLNQQDAERSRLEQRDQIETERLQQEESQGARTDLRIVLGRLYELQSAYTRESSGSNPSTFELERLNSEIALLAAQALDATTRISGGVSTTEYLSVAYFLYLRDDSVNAEAMYRQAIQAIDTRTDFANAHRSYASFLFQQGRLEDGRSQFQMALEMGEAFHFPNPHYLTMMLAHIEVAWGQAEVGQSECDNARRHLERASNLNAHLDDPSTAGWYQIINRQLDALEASIKLCIPSEMAHLPGPYDVLWTSFDRGHDRR